MIDNLTLVKTIESHSHVLNKVNESLPLFNLVFDPILKNGEVVGYAAKHKNLYLKIVEDRLIIKNSLCKFYHGYNHENLSFTQLNQAATGLENTLGLPLRDALVRSFEYGIILHVRDP